MDISRRKFFKITAAAGGMAACAGVRPAQAREAIVPDPNWYGMLNDSARCVGCKACQSACKIENKLPMDSTLGDAAQFGQPIFDSPRELTENTYTLIQLHQDDAGKPTFVKRQCMHCVDPACQSACIVGALKKQPTGDVKYDGGMCMGCRYCMVACPYNVPQFEWHKAIPVIRKCTLCSETKLKEGKPTACSTACPAGAIVFGKREELLRLAKERIKAQPEVYLDHVYGETEVGGTNVLYLTKKNVSFASLGLPAFGHKGVAVLTESIQHRLFQYFIPPIAIYSILGGIMYFNQKRKKNAGTLGGDDEY